MQEEFLINSANLSRVSSVTINDDNKQKPNIIIAKQDKDENHTTNTNIATDGNRIAMFNLQNSDNQIRDIGMIVSKSGEITHFDLSYNRERNLPKSEPFNEITNVAIQQAQNTNNGETSNVMRKLIYYIRNFIKNKNTQALTAGEMTESDIQEVFEKLKKQMTQLKWKKKNTINQEMLKCNREETLKIEEIRQKKQEER